MSTRLLRAALAIGLCLLQIAAPAAAQEDLDFEIERADQLSRTAPWQESQRVIDRLLERLEQAEPDQRAKILILYARNLAIAGDEAGGLEVLKELHEQTGSELSAERRLRALNLAANIAVNMEDFEQTFGFLGQGLSLHSEVDDPGLRSETFSLAAFFHSQAGEIPLALDYSWRAVASAREAGDVSNECAALQRLALSQQAAEQDQAQAETLVEALTVCEQAGFRVVLATVKLGLGDLARRTGDLEQAGEQIEAGLAVMEEAGFHTGILSARRDLGFLRQDQGRIDEAERLYLDLVDPFVELGYWMDLAELHRRLAGIAVDRGELARAIEHYDARIYARERHLNAERSRRLTYLQAEFDAHRREQEIALLEERNQVMMLEREARARQTLLYVFGTVALAAIGLLLLVLLLRTRAERRKFRRLAETDGLTGLNNHSRFFDLARAAITEAHQSGQNAVLVYADIDHFKRFNDEHGHDLGDEVLRRVGSRLRERFGSSAVVGRIGGEEFAVLLPGRNLEQAVAEIDGFRRRIDEVRSADRKLKVTLSFGMAQLQPGDRLSVLRQRVDRALYQAKTSGRDQLVLASPTGT